MSLRKREGDWWQRITNLAHWQAPQKPEWTSVHKLNNLVAKAHWFQFRYLPCSSSWRGNGFTYTKPHPVVVLLWRVLHETLNASAAEISDSAGTSGLQIEAGGERRKRAWGSENFRPVHTGRVGTFARKICMQSLWCCLQAVWTLPLYSTLRVECFDLKVRIPGMIFSWSVSAPPSRGDKTGQVIMSSKLN